MPVFKLIFGIKVSLYIKIPTSYGTFELKFLSTKPFLASVDS